MYYTAPHLGGKTGTPLADHEVVGGWRQAALPTVLPTVEIEPRVVQPITAIASISTIGLRTRRVGPALAAESRDTRQPHVCRSRLGAIRGVEFSQHSLDVRLHLPAEITDSSAIC